MDSAERLSIELVFADAPDHVQRAQLSLPAGATVADALAAAGFVRREAIERGGLAVGVWGRVQPLGTVLRDRDRVEVLRPLAVDPKEARRLRHARQRAEATPKGKAGRTSAGR